MWLGPPKTSASARRIALPPFLIDLLGAYLGSHNCPQVFPTVDGGWQRRSNYSRRVLRPAVDGNLHIADPRVRCEPVQPGMTFHGLRHSHKTWLIADGAPEIAQARRLGHHLDNRVVETYSHVAPEVEAKLLRGLEDRWHHAQPGPHTLSRPQQSRARRQPVRRLGLLRRLTTTEPGWWSRTGSD